MRWIIKPATYNLLHGMPWFALYFVLLFVFNQPMFSRQVSLHNPKIRIPIIYELVPRVNLRATQVLWIRLATDSINIDFLLPLYGKISVGRLCTSSLKHL